MSASQRATTDCSDGARRSVAIGAASLMNDWMPQPESWVHSIVRESQLPFALACLDQAFDRAKGLLGRLSAVGIVILHHARPAESTDARGPRVLRAFEATPIAIAGTNYDPQEVFPQFGIEHSSSFSFPRTKSPESFRHTSDKALHSVRQPPYPCETRLPFRESHRPTLPAAGLSTARGYAASRRTVFPTRAAPPWGWGG